MTGRFGVEVWTFYLVDCVVKDLEFPMLADLGSKKVVAQNEEITRRASDSNIHVRSGKKEKEGRQEHAPQLEISTYFERASKQEQKPVAVDEGGDAVVEGNDPVSHVDEDDEMQKEDSREDASPNKTLKADPQRVTAEDSISGKPTTEESKTKDSTAQTENPYSSIEPQVNQSHYQHPHSSRPNLSQPGNNRRVPQEAPSRSTTQQPSVPFAADFYDDTLDQYINLGPFEQTPQEPQPQNLDSLIQACNNLLPVPKPIRLVVPLPVHPVQLTDPPDSTSQDVVNAWTQSPLERTKEIWMYPVQDGSARVRYVSGPPLKKRRVFNVLPEGFETTCPGGYNKVERMVETGVCPLMEGLSSLAGRVMGGGEDPVKENDDLVLPGERYGA
jgi:hypothetical protein